MRGIQLGRTAGVTALAIMLAGGLAMGCNGEEEEEGPVACTVETEEQDCSEGELCIDEVCVEGERENQEEGPEIVEENYQVSVLGFTALQPRQSEFRLVGSRDGSTNSFLPESIDCASAQLCSLTADRSHFLLVRAPGTTLEVQRASFDAETATIGTLETWLTDVSNVRVRENGILFNRVEGERYGAFFADVASGEETLVGELHPVGSSPARYWDADPRSDRAVMFLPTLDSLDVRVGRISTGVPGPTYVTTFGRENRPGDGGSLYIGQIPTGFSPDGRYVAIRTVGPNAHNNCASDADCTGTSQVCGTDQRCVAVESTIHIFDMEHAADIGDSCSSHDDCGPVHRCDSRYADFREGICRPQRTVVGVPNSPSQGNPSLSGCGASRMDGSYGFTDARAPLSFGPDGKIYLVAERNCIRDTATGDETEANIAQGVIIAVDPLTGELEPIFGNIAREDYSDARCYDVEEQRLDIEDCVISIARAQLSPDGNDVVFMGSHPGAGTGQLARQIFDVWRVRRDGEDHDWIGQMSQQFRVDSFQVHRTGEASTAE